MYAFLLRSWRAHMRLHMGSSEPYGYIQDKPRGTYSVVRRGC